MKLRHIDLKGNLLAEDDLEIKQLCYTQETLKKVEKVIFKDMTVDIIWNDPRDVIEECAELGEYQ